MTAESPVLRWYGERGIINALVSYLASEPEERVPALLAAIKWADGATPRWIANAGRAVMLVEWGLADFGNPDLILVCDTASGARCVFLEAKVGPYLSSMKPNAGGMRDPGFNSSINGQLTLKFRFASALEQANASTLTITEPVPLLQQYRAHHGDPRLQPSPNNSRQLLICRT